MAGNQEPFHLNSNVNSTGGIISHGSHHRYWWLAYVAFVVYGSLVPLEFRPVDPGQAWLVFKHMPLLQLGVESRADWIANGILYIPIGFLTVSALPSQNGAFKHLLVLLGASAFGIALALAVEFAQVFFPPRTVSLNDVLAECVGTFAGVIIAAYWSTWFRELLTAVTGRGERFADHVLHAYAAAYCAFSVFPLDFVLSATELAGKLHSDAWGWLIAGQSLEQGKILLFAKLLAEALAAAPLGILTARRRERAGQPVLLHASLCGLALGLLIEVVQFFIYSGISQGLSLATRSGGMCVGAFLWRQRTWLRTHIRSDAAIRLAKALIPIYLLSAVAVSGWFSHAWQDMDRARAILAETRLQPFYYHYYTTEQAALISLAAIALLYAPIGVFSWVTKRHASTAILCSTLLAGVIEVSKLFLQGLHPDPSNLFIAALSAWVAHESSARIESWPSGVGESIRTQPAPNFRESQANRGSIGLLFAAVFVGWTIFDFPAGSLLLATAYAVYGAILWRNPRWLWLTIPAALPLLDLAPWTGRFFFDEFDGLILLSLVIGYSRTQGNHRRLRSDTIFLVTVGLIAASFAVGAMRGLLPLTLPDANAFNNYFSPYNALRVGKGALWALLLIGLKPRFPEPDVEIDALLAKGLTIGLAGTIAVVIWERFTFSGIFNFTDVYRATGPFSQMHTGGADLETYLVASTPFLFTILAKTSRFWKKAIAMIILLGATYGILVTFSRAGYAGFAVASSVSLFMLLANRREARQRSKWVWPLALASVALSVALPFYRGSFAEERIARTGTDLRVRAAHWEDALSLRDSSWSTALFGMGLGRFPVSHYWLSSETRAASYRLERDGANNFVRMAPGSPLYLEQFVDLQPDKQYSFGLDIRSPNPQATITIFLCEKWLLTSSNCVNATIAPDPDSVQWKSKEIRLSSGSLGQGPWYARAPVKLSLSNSSSATIDVDNVRLVTTNGQDLVANSGFSDRLDRWFFSVDLDLPWHIWSLPVAAIFELGWSGLFALGFAFVVALVRAGRKAKRGDVSAGALLGALSGLAIIGSVDTIIDSPRLTLLLLLLIFLAIENTKRPNIRQA